jgi:hypothetical protein
MQKIENNQPNLNRIIRRVLFDTSSVTSANRLKFRRLTFSDQAMLIGMYAKLQLRSADKLISQHMSGRTKPTAAYLWFRVQANLYERPAANIRADKESDHLITGTINRLYPHLSVVSENITRLFTGSFRYWVDNFYSCDIDGKFNSSACLNSSAQRLSKDDIKMINDGSKMAYLGEHIKRYADHLIVNALPLIYKKEN